MFTIEVSCSAVMAAYHVIKTPPRADTHAAVLGLFAAVLVNALLTNFVKIMVRIAALRPGDTMVQTHFPLRRSRCCMMTQPTCGLLILAGSSQ